jgi:hypothetical protein
MFCLDKLSVKHSVDIILKWIKNYYAFMLEDELVPYNETNLSDDEIYNILKPKLDKADVLKYGYYYHDHTMFNADETIKAIALAYRSGYLRAKKGRPFKIGGEKE